MSMKPWDARLARTLVRPLADSRLVHPNHFTLLRLVVGIAGAAAFAASYAPNVAALLVVLSNFLDHTDGELARMSGKTSRFGHYFDLTADAIVTVALFAGIGIGLAHGTVGGFAIVLGTVAGIAVAVIFHLRNLMEGAHGKAATKQPQWGGFEAEDVLYLMPLVTLSGSLEWFLYAAGLGAPVACAVVVLSYRRTMRAAGGQRA